MRRIDLTGQVIEDMTVIEYLGYKKYLCRCKCGQEEVIGVDSLKHGYKCKCTHNETRLGLKFGEWTVIGIPKESMWLCRCSCGKEQLVRKYDLEHGTSTSCGHGRLQDYTGKQIGNWRVDKYLGSKEYLCTNLISGQQQKVSTERLKKLFTGVTKQLSGEVKFDLSGKRFGDWEVQYYVGKNLWHCKCSCGKESDVNGFALRDGTTTSCGHATTGFRDLTGKVFGQLTVEKYLGADTYYCKCSCGRHVTRKGKTLKSGDSDSCGHMRLIRQSLAKNSNRTEEQINKGLYKENMQSIITPGVTTYSDLAKELGVVYGRAVGLCRKYGLVDQIARDVGSKGEDSLYDYICTLIDPSLVERHNRTILSGKELDIYIPSKKLAIEFNGIYWHSTLFKDKLYHQQKTINCAQRGIRLIHIFEYEWTDEIAQDKLRKYIKDIIIGPKVIGARQTKLDYVSKEDADLFLELNHLQGSINSKINIGLYFDKELVGVMTFGDSRFSSEYEYEILRMCFKSGLSITSGAQKMLGYFVDKHNPKSIITYSDITKFTGNVYLHLGFKPIQPNPITTPNYVWVEPLENTVLSRYQTQKAKLVELGYDESLTENEIMDDLGFVKIYNSGNIKLDWKQ